MSQLSNYVEEFFMTLSLEGDGKSGRYRKIYIKQSIESFLSNENNDTAFRVYMAFCNSYQLTENGDTFINLLDVLKEYEETTGPLVDNQRDHYIHSVNVFLLGLCMYSQNATLRRCFERDFENNMYYDSEQSEFFYRWGISALFHDIGYPVEIISKQLKKFFDNATDIADIPFPKIQSRVIINNFDDLNTLPDMGDFDTFKEGFTALYAETTANPHKALDYIAYGVHYRFGLDFNQVKGMLDKFPESMRLSGFIDHGFYSALLIMRWYASLIQQSNINGKAFVPVISSASAIMLHNYYGNVLKKEFKDLGPLMPSTHPLAYLLMLCDELQEWNRAAYTEADAAGFVASVANIEISNDKLCVQYRTDVKIPNDENILRAGAFKDKKKKVVSDRLNITSLFINGFVIDTVMNTDYSTAVKIRIPARQLINNTEMIAKSIHEQYLVNMKEKGKSGPATVPWEMLSDDIIAQNFRQAFGIVDQLTRIHCSFATDDASVTGLTAFTDDKVEEMAQYEHDTWMKEHIKNGWVYGPHRDDKRKIHPCLLSWTDLSAEYKETDRKAIRNIIPLLNNIGLKVYRV